MHTDIDYLYFYLYFYSNLYYYLYLYLYLNWYLYVWIERLKRKYGESLLVGRRGVSSLMNVSMNWSSNAVCFMHFILTPKRFCLVIRKLHFLSYSYLIASSFTTWNEIVIIIKPCNLFKDITASHQHENICFISCILED